MKDMIQTIKPRKRSGLKKPTPVNRNINNSRGVKDENSLLPVDSVRVIITAADPKYNSHVFLRKYTDKVGSVKADWCRLENVSMECVDFFCGNGDLSEDQTLREIEEFHPGIIDIICVRSTKGLVRIIVRISSDVSPDPLLFLRTREDFVRTIKLDVARALNVDSSLMILTCDGSYISDESNVGQLRKKCPNVVELQAMMLSKTDIAVQSCATDGTANAVAQTNPEPPSDALRSETSNGTLPLPGGTIRVRVGSIVTQCRASPSDTFGSVVEQLRAAHLFMSVVDVELNGSSLWCPSWMERPLYDCQWSPGAELVFQTPKQMAHVELYSPPGSAPREWTLEVQLKEVCWAAFASCDVQLSRSNVVLQFGLFYLRQGLWRRAVHSLNLENGKKGFYAESDGEPVDEVEASQAVCEILAPSSGIRGACGFAPVLTAFSGAEVLRVIRPKDPVLKLADLGALFDPRAFLLIRGIRLRCQAQDSDRFFLLLAGVPAFCDVSDGSVHNDLRDIDPALQSRWTEVFVVLFEGEILPRWPIPFGRQVRILRRHGLDIQVSCDRRIRRHTPGPRPQGSDWTRPIEADNFLNAVTTAIRRLPS